MHIRLIVHDIRSTYNVGSLLRTADGLGVEHVYLSGYTPYPHHEGDARLPHLSRKLTAQIHKTALGAEQSVPWSQHDDIVGLLAQLRSDGFQIVALEQAAESVSLPDFTADGPVALLIGREVEGIAPELLGTADRVVEIPMLGQKESLNVVQATAIALFHLRYS